MNRPFLALLFFAIATLPGLAAHGLLSDRPISGQRLLIRDAGPGSQPTFVLDSYRSEALSLTDLPDPRVRGAALEIVGRGTNGITSEVIELGPRGWRGLGRRAGSGGYRYQDDERGLSVLLRGDAQRGRLRVRAHGDDLGIALNGPQQGVLLRLRIGGQTFCSSFPPSSLRRNDASVVTGRRGPSPDSCALAGCGNGTVDPGEECDDGNTQPHDGCSPTCRVEGSDDLCHGVAVTSSERLALELVASGLDRPVYAVSPPRDTERLWIVEQPGRIRLHRNGSLDSVPVLDIRGRVSCCGERGLLSVAFHPEYADNGRFFVNYTDTTGTTVVSRFQISSDPDRAVADSERVLLRIAQDFSNHNGGQLAFGPDGYLYVGMGDGGAGGDPRERAQDPASLLGKMLRLDVDRDGAPYHARPSTNPHTDRAAPFDLIWATGLRNPWRFSFDRATGDLYIADVGQSAREEVNFQPAGSVGGENYGWDVFEGTVCFNPPPLFPGCPAPEEGFVFPIHEYPHPSGCSITGGYVYRGCRMPDLHGTYFYSDFCNPFVRTFEVIEARATNHRDRTSELSGVNPALSGITSFGEDASGEIYLTLLDGRVFRLAPGTPH